MVARQHDGRVNPKTMEIGIKEFRQAATFGKPLGAYVEDPHSCLLAHSKEPKLPSRMALAPYALSFRLLSVLSFSPSVSFPSSCALLPSPSLPLAFSLRLLSFPLVLYLRLLSFPSLSLPSSRFLGSCLVTQTPSSAIPTRV